MAKLRLQWAMMVLASLLPACDDQAGSNAGLGAAPEQFVVCTGWHALCSASPDCRQRGDKADCDCMRVNETHIVLTDAIQDPELKIQTLAQCTEGSPCGVDQAPVCSAIRERRYRVGGVEQEWVSTFSYRGWCSLLAQKPVLCDPTAPGYVGDRFWAICDGAPCTENPSPSDPARPLTCECRVEESPFVGLSGCTGKNGGIISSSPASAWDFQNNTYRDPLPGDEYVRGACDSVRSDPPPSP
jgi:hypothetical protein